MKSLKAFLGKEMTSIDIGSYNTKIVQGISLKNELIVSKAYCFPTPTSSYKDGQIFDVEKIAENIKEVMTEKRFKLNKQTVCTLESSSIISREISIPFAKESEMIEAVEFEMEQYLPIDIDKYVIEYKLVEVYKEEQTKKARVLVAALPLEIANSYFELLNLLKCKPNALDIHSNCANKLYTFMGNDEMEGKTISLIDLGYEHINVVIIQNGIFKFSRLLNVGSKNVDMNIANALNIYLKEAEEKKMGLDGLGNMVAESSEEYTIRDNTKQTINTWLESIQRIFRYYISRGSSNKIDYIYLYGGGSNISGIVELFRDFFDVETTRLDNISNVKIESFDGYIKEDLIYYINALGAMVGR